MYQELQKGWIEVITGPMFAGKSEELIRRIKTLTYTKMKIMAFKPAIDNRYDKTAIASHDGAKYEAYAVKEAKSILELVRPDTQVVAIDEVQFFSNDIIGICESLADRGVRVIVAGLDLDFRGEPFGPMPELLARAEFVTKLTAVCTVCGCAATRTQRMINGKPADYNDPIIKVGAKESYEARCRKHHMVPGKPKDIH
jgi:thymidine kinase